ncbi:patatin-like phospholipase [Tetraselmis virus 1]|uniref:Patatin-like phospholipase n=1 Tax=Tetraselmis virus 1 TaxID=2060617 RepID=A0A2P0VN83_9VIRU|nr:patatin-like phospholipase [Tetraselmis virus 1]AUF82366.1 patatin-like phospholipase [Tetraselmis virus 1]
MYVNLAISGGAHFCISFLGFLRKVRSSLKDVKNVSASSGGALVALAFVLDIPDDITIRIIQRHVTKGIFDRIDITELLDKFGTINTIEAVSPLVEDILITGINRWKTFKQAWWDNDNFDVSRITLQDLSKITGINLAVCVSDVSNGFSRKFITPSTHSDTPVVWAVCASCAVPMVLTPVKLTDKLLYADACVTDSDLTLIDYFDEISPCPDGTVDTLSLEITFFSVENTSESQSQPTNPENLLEYVQSLMTSICGRIFKTSTNPRCISAKIPKWTNDRVSPLIFGMTPVDINTAYNCGLAAANAYLESYL